MSDGRTEAATPKRKREARRKGQVARSVELGQGMGLAIAALLLPTSLGRAANALTNDWQAAAGAAGHAEPGSAAALLGRMLGDTAFALAPLVLALAAGGVAGSLAMAGVRPNLAHLKPKFSHINPRQGVKRIASKQAAWELIKVSLKLTLLALVSYGAWQGGVHRLLSGPDTLPRFLAIVGGAGSQILIRVAALGAFIGLADAVVSKRRHMRQLRMTKHEVREEHKQTEGNPVIRGEIRKKQMRMSRMRMIAEVARADVVLTNPTHLAVALAYQQGSVTPVVVAKGAGVIAEKIRGEARRHGVPIRENKPLARTLFRSVEVGDAIPINLYQAVAEVLAAIYRAPPAGHDVTAFGHPGGRGGGMNMSTRLPRVIIPLLIVAIVGVMVIPLPHALLDLLLAMNITLSVLILLTAMLVKQPLDFSVFPALLLVTTLFRLALNVSTTRLILRDGYAGKVIQAFGGFVVSGNLVIGLVIFMILVVIQFAVITNGAGRVAEVAARFTLDAMPGKQMAIDADLNAGLITDEEARRRRLEVGREADFYGAMDGASKFIKGDAIAAVVIVVINLLGGFGVGMFQLGLPLNEAVNRFSLLSVGDGLVSQIPALLISVASGIIVTRVATEEDGGLGSDMWSQLLRNQRVLGIGAGAVAFLAILPGLPKVPFLVLAGALAVAASRRRDSDRAAAPELTETAPSSDTPESLLSQLRVEPLELELAPDLFDLVDPARGGSLLERVKVLRRQIALDLGLVIPLVRTRDNLTLPPSTYVIKVNGIEAGRGEAPPGCVLVLADGDPSLLPGRPTTEPVFGLPAAWVPQELAENLEASGSTVVDRGSVVVTHLSELVRRHAADLLSRQDVQALVDAVRDLAPSVASDVGGETIGLAEVQRVLRGLLGEGVPIRDIVRILEALTARARETCDPELLLEAARQALAGTISAQVADDGVLHALTLEPLLEQSLLEALRVGESGSYLAVDPFQTEALLEGIGQALSDAERRVARPVLVCSPQLRPAIRRLVAAGRPQLSVLSYPELNRSLTIEPVGVVHLVAGTATV